MNRLALVGLAVASAVLPGSLFGQRAPVLQQVKVPHPYYFREMFIPQPTTQVARQARVRLDTVRYYERRGLLPPPPRTAAGYRQYAPETVRRVAFIKRAQTLGFTLEEIEQLLALRVTPGPGCTAVERSARSAIQRLDQQLADLQRMRGALARLAEACHSQHATDECPLLDAIEPQDDETAD